VLGRRGGGARVLKPYYVVELGPEPKVLSVRLYRVGKEWVAVVPDDVVVAGGSRDAVVELALLMAGEGEPKGFKVVEHPLEAVPDG
jgi:hypothetical protein